MEGMEITNVFFREMNKPGSSLKAFANVEFNGILEVKNWKIFEGRNGVFAKVPQEGNGKDWFDTVRWADKSFYGENAKTHPILNELVDKWKAYKGKAKSSAPAQSDSNNVVQPWE